MAKGIPRHVLVKNQILAELQKGGLQQNGRLPSEDELAIIYDVSRTTIRSALQSLESEGIIEKRHGSGNFIKPFNKTSNRNAMFAMLNRQEAAQIMKKCSIKKVDLSADIAEKLDEKEGSPAYKIIKTFCLDDMESSCMVEYIPAKHVKVVPSPDSIPSSVYVFAARYCGVEVGEIRSEFHAVSHEETPFYDVAHPVIRIDETFLSTTEKIILYSEYYINTDLICPCVIRDKPPQFWKTIDGHIQ